MRSGKWRAEAEWARWEAGEWKREVSKIGSPDTKRCGAAEEWKDGVPFREEGVQ